MIGRQRERGRASRREEVSEREERSAQSGRLSKALAMSDIFSTSVLIPLPRPSTYIAPHELHKSAGDSRGQARLEEQATSPSCRTVRLTCNEQLYGIIIIYHGGKANLGAEHGHLIAVVGVVHIAWNVDHSASHVADSIFLRE